MSTKIALFNVDVKILKTGDHAMVCIDLTEIHPSVAYEGQAPEYADSLDYVEIPLKGEVIA